VVAQTHSIVEMVLVLPGFAHFDRFGGISKMWRLP
jgi:hypothetical protein